MGISLLRFSQALVLGLLRLGLSASTLKLSGGKETSQSGVVYCSELWRSLSSGVRNLRRNLNDRIDAAKRAIAKSAALVPDIPVPPVVAKPAKHKRRNPNYREKMCALILAHFGVPHDVGRRMTLAEIERMVVFDHDPVPFAIARDLDWGPAAYNHASNLVARLRPDHDIKTRTKDVPAIAKAARISDEQKAFQARMLAKTGGEPAPSRLTSRLRSRPFPVGHRKMQSRPFQKKVKT